jgi:hypothetical protein
MELTAVEWLEKQINNGQFIPDKLIQQAKEMEKKQIIKAREDIYTTGHLSAEQYYNETFNK